MTQPFIGQIEIFGFNFAPYTWAFAAGQLVPIQQNTALFALIGNLYGGDGRVTFALPNMASNQACGSGQGPGLTERSIGETFGAFNVSLTVDEIPQHNHVVNFFKPAGPETVAPSTNSGIGVVQTGNVFIYAAAGMPQTTMSPMMLQPAGGNQPHPNQQPYLGLNYCIALEGDFPAFP